LLSFVDRFPGDDASGMPGTNFAGNCNSAFFPDSHLLKPCAPMPEDIKTCQKLGKKVIMALGGATTYKPPTVDSAVDFADKLWSIFGPQSANNGEPRPFEDSEVDGFDFDIEYPSPGK
jgi:chitinase